MKLMHAFVLDRLILMRIGRGMVVKSRLIQVFCAAIRAIDQSFNRRIYTRECNRIKRLTWEQLCVQINTSCHFYTSSYTVYFGCGKCEARRKLWKDFDQRYDFLGCPDRELTNHCRDTPVVSYSSGGHIAKQNRPDAIESGFNHRYAECQGRNRENGEIFFDT